MAAHYGDTLDGKVEAVLAANPGLSALSAVLDAGVRIALPDLSITGPVETEQLWG
ncbi:tail protein X [uncultured Ruegeria sp.]|uniref:tail protein X n=1 Tax=uncultured Ruegeria sp. TaxID=259304 RepID=UPI00261CC9B5|nr:tail protein X [uncultured Ruegeria sp.]